VRNRGFTLIETLVAISILAISLVVILQLFSGGLKSSKLSDEYTRGIFHAREKMDEILLTGELTEGVIGGEFEDGFRWKAEALPLGIEEAKDLKLPFRAFNIKVDVMWDAGGQEKHFAVSAIKLVKTSNDNLLISSKISR
jgi:general secretion pathway protein I